MNKIKLIISLSLIFAGTSVFANIAKSVPQFANAQYQETKEETSSNEISSYITEETINEIKSCKPINEKYDLDILGINITFKIKISGWTDDICTYNLSGKINKLSKDFRQSFNIKISDSQMSKIEPQVQCNFNKEQLDILVQAILEEDKRTVENLKLINDNPEEYIQQMSKTKELTPAEEKLTTMIIEQNLCSVPNMTEIMTQLENLSKSN